MVRTAPSQRLTPSAFERGLLKTKVRAGTTPNTDVPPADIHSPAVFAASWCCSVGATWTVELRSMDCAAQGRPAEWICSGVPTDQPAPDRQTADLLRERGLLLFPVDPADPAHVRVTTPPPPRSRSRQPIGYVTRDPELMRLATMLTHVAHAQREHPMVVAARWIQRGYRSLP